MVTAGIAVTPRNYQLYQDLAMIDLKSTGVEAALATADRLSAQDRDFVGSARLKGDLYLAANRPDDAVDAYPTHLPPVPTAASSPAWQPPSCAPARPTRRSRR